MRTLQPIFSAARITCGLLVLTTALLLWPGCGSQADDDDDFTELEEETPDVTPTSTPSEIATDWDAQATDIMSFWTTYNIDESAVGGYFSGVGRSGTILSTNKWTRSVSRQVYGYVKTFQLTGDPTQLELARSGVDFLKDYAYDSTYGGFRTELDRDGQVLSDARDMFDQIYALVGLAAYVEVTHDPEITQLVENSYSLLEARAWDTEYGGYYKALSPEMTVTLNDEEEEASLLPWENVTPTPTPDDGSDDGKEFNSLVDTATAYLFTLYAATGSDTYKTRLQSIGYNIVDHLIDPDGTGWIGENFDRFWNYEPDGTDFGGDITLCGHNLKTAWTLLRLWAVTDTELFKTEAESLLELTLQTCRDTTYGGIYDQVDRESSTLANGTVKAWWQQEQGMVACQLMAAIADKSYYANISEETRDFYLSYFLDTSYGEVYAQVREDGLPMDSTKGNEWKSAYHSIETAYFGRLYDAFFKSLEPVTLYYSFDPYSEERVIRLAPAEVPYGTYTIDDPAYLDGTGLSLTTPSTITIPAEGGILAVVYRPAG